MPEFAAFLDAWIRAHAEAAQAFLAELVRVPSDNPPGDCLPIAERAAALLENLGLSVERHPVPAALVRSHGMARVTNLIVRERFGGGGPVVALNAHGDAVPPGDGWSVPPYSAAIRAGQMFGRGVAVSKSDFATYTFALLALRAARSDPTLKHRLKGTAELHFTFDEEAGGELGPAWLLKEKLTKPDYAICAGFSYAVVIAHTVSATPGIGHPTLVVGKIEGGINTNVVPDRVRFRIDRRILPEESPARAEQDLIAHIMRADTQVLGVTVDVNRLLLAEPLRPTEASRKLGALLARHVEAVLGEAVPLLGVPLYTDARHYAARGVPVVLYGAGPKDPGKAGAHGPDERLRLEDLHVATRVVARTLADLLADPLPGRN
jgi:succinyl-diaminopimelate desuccinylase